MTNHPTPRRLFRAGSEPNGEKVQSYSELSLIDDIPNALDEDRDGANEEL